MTRSSFFLLSAALGTFAAGLGLAQSAEDLRMTVGKSIVIDYPSDVQQISTSDPAVLDASPVTTREILVHGKGLGSATMVVWSKAGQRTFYNVSVDLNLDPLRRLLRESFPNDTIEPRSSRDSISLNGHVSSKDVGDRAMALATSFSKTVVNNLQLGIVPVDKQILLRVKFAELDRIRESQFGVNLLSTGATNTIGRVTTGQFPAPGISSLTGNTPGQPATPTSVTVTDALNIFAFRPDLNLGAFIKALQSEQILQILAEPNLVTTNGKEAQFLVGGEFPVPILQGGANAGAVTVQFREFGIRLKFTPTITENKTIKLVLRHEVSTLDAANGVALNGFIIPALSTRRAETEVELGEGQSFVIAGLVDNRESETFSKIPVLSELPIFGALFKTRDDKKSRTELVVLVTPEVTEPLGSNDTKPDVYLKSFLKRLIPRAPSRPRPWSRTAVRRIDARRECAGRTQPMSSRVQNEAEISAVLIAPDRGLAQQFLDTLPETRAFQILADLKTYPPHNTLEIRARQLKPDVVLLDLASDLSAATELIRFIAALKPPVHVIGLHTANDSRVILQSLRAGASEFLYAPFDLVNQREAIARVRRLCVPEPPEAAAAGNVVAFSSAKPGSGASTIATQTAFLLQRLTSRRILLADFDLTGGTIGFYLKLSHNYSLVDALQHAEHLDPALWASLTVNYGGVDILPAPAVPFAEALDPARMRILIHHARELYDWVILDLPAVFNRTSLMAISECDRAFLVSTSELPSLHMTRKALSLVAQVGFPADRFQVLVNRVDRRDHLGVDGMEKIFGCRVHASLPNDYFSLHRVVTLGQPLGNEGELGKSIENIASRLCGALSPAKKSAPALREAKPALSTT
jgi:pilus assembly protein CpaC